MNNLFSCYFNLVWHMIDLLQGGITASIAGKTDYYSRLQPYFDHLMKVTPALERRVVLSRPYVDLLGLGTRILYLFVSHALSFQ